MKAQSLNCNILKFSRTNIEMKFTANNFNHFMVPMKSLLKKIQTAHLRLRFIDIRMFSSKVLTFLKKEIILLFIINFVAVHCKKEALSSDFINFLYDSLVLKRGKYSSKNEHVFYKSCHKQNCNEWKLLIEIKYKYCCICMQIVKLLASQMKILVLHINCYDFQLYLM